MCDKSKLLCNFAQIFKEIVMRKRFIHILWAVFGTGILTVVLAFVAIWFGMIGYMPDIEDLQNPINRFATQVYSADGKVLGTWNLNKENRIVIPYKKMSPYLIKALVATEDERFYEHSGIDFRALGRAMSSVVFWDRLMRVVEVPSRSSSPSSFILRRQAVQWNDCCRSR